MDWACGLPLVGFPGIAEVCAVVCLRPGYVRFLGRRRARWRLRARAALGALTGARLGANALLTVLAFGLVLAFTLLRLFQLAFKLSDAIIVIVSWLLLGLVLGEELAS